MKIALLGTVGVPGEYGGFETLAENLVHYHARNRSEVALTVWCSGKDKIDHPDRFERARLRYIDFRANGVQSIPYDALSLWQAIRSGHDRIVLLGVSGAMTLPLVRLISKARIVTNIDGIEWKRAKWNCLVRFFLRASEWAAVRFSHAVVADNAAISDYVHDRYGTDCHCIAYGGDHALASKPLEDHSLNIPKDYTLGLCRIEPENNVTMILEAFRRMPERNLVFIGNWNASHFGRELKENFDSNANLHLLDPIYDVGRLRWIRDNATEYVHGHSAGGTNPSLVEMMHFGIPIFAHGCDFNRCTTEGRACYFENVNELVSSVQRMDRTQAREVGENMREIASRRYTWERIGLAYFDLLQGSG